VRGSFMQNSTCSANGTPESQLDDESFFSPDLLSKRFCFPRSRSLIYLVNWRSFCVLLNPSLRTQPPPEFGFFLHPRYPPMVYDTVSDMSLVWAIN
jgi:hypothetical protein